MQRCKYHKGAEMNFLKMKSSTGSRLYKVDVHGCMTDACGCIGIRRMQGIIRLIKKFVDFILK